MENIISGRITVANAGVPITLERDAGCPTVIKMFQGDNLIRVSVPDAPILLKQLLHLFSMDAQP